MPTPRPDSAPEPGADQTVRLGPGAAGAEMTVRLGAPVGAGTAPGAEELTVRLTGEPGEPTTPPAATAVEETVRLAPGEAEQTVRLAPGTDGAAGAQTVRLSTQVPFPAAAGAAGPDAEATVRLDGEESAAATFLDPRVWGGAPDPDVTLPTATTTLPTMATTLHETGHGTGHATGHGTGGSEAAARQDAAPQDAPPQDEPPLAPGELRRFGPGIPPQAAAVWHGEAAAEEPAPRRRRRRWLVPVAVLLAILAFLSWRFSGPDLAVTGVGVSTDQAGPGCNGTAVITAAVETNGGAGTIRYRWLRSDGTTSGEILQDVRSGARRTDLVLRWSFEGHGSLQATATLEILSPGTRTAAASFAYTCA